jgi:hypothetical protein
LHFLLCLNLHFEFYFHFHSLGHSGRQLHPTKHRRWGVAPSRRKTSVGWDMKSQLKLAINLSALLTSRQRMRAHLKACSSRLLPMRFRQNGSDESDPRIINARNVLRTSRTWAWVYRESCCRRDVVGIQTRRSH